MAVEGKDDVRWMALLATFLSVLVTVYIVYVGIPGWALSRRGRRTGWLPSPPSMASLPLVGSFAFMTSCHGLFYRFFAQKAKTLGPVFTCRLGSKLTLVLNDRATINEALIKKSAFFSGRELFYPTKVYFNPKAKGIIYRQYNEDFRRYHQQMLTILKDFGLGQNEMETRINREIDELIGLVDSKQGQPFDPTELLSLCTLNVVASILFANRLPLTDPELRRLNDNIHKYIHSVRYYVIFCPFLRFFPPFRGTLSTGLRQINDIKRFIENGFRASLEMKKTVASFVASFVAKEKETGTYDEEDLFFACRDLLEAGSDTTATTLLWSMELLANNPDIQRRLHEEIDAHLAPHEQPTSSDASRLPYVEATILEVLRLRTVLPLSLPHKVVDDTTVAGFYVPKGTMVLLNLYAVHMDKETWGDPEVFRPDRFLDESGEHVVGKNRVIPFSIGRRSCLGEGIARQELFLVFTNLLQHFEIRPPEGQKSIYCRPMPATIVAPTPFQVRLIPRKR